MIHNIKNNKGFTLIEIIIVIIVLGVLSVFGFSFISTAVHTYSKMEKQKSLFDQAVMAMERISRELRDASTITTATGSTLAFTKSHGTPQETSTYDIRFRLSSNTLQRIGSTAPAAVDLADNVSAFTVTNSSNEITISLTLEEAGGENITLRTCIYPKNLAFAGDNYSGRNFAGDWEENYQ